MLYAVAGCSRLAISMSGGYFGGVLIGLGRERSYDGGGFSKGAWAIGNARNYESSGRALGEGGWGFFE